MTRCALISAWDKTGCGELARDLETLGFTILSTSSTAKHLRGFCRAVVEVSDVTGFPEILDGRVKTLHPKIHGAILADRNQPSHLQTLAEHGIERIDLVAVNLYPFAETLRRQGATEAEIIENIDIGGPTLIRAAAKNHRHVLPLTDPADYPAVLNYLRGEGEIPLDFRRYLAGKAFALVSDYDRLIASWFAPVSEASAEVPLEYRLSLNLATPLRYGENPHQKAGFYLSGASGWEVLHGKELSFNNLLDIDSSFRALRLFERPAAVITKHCNPCGIACAEELCDAYDLALATDPESPFGGIVAVNRELDLATAEAINRLFTEIIIAPAFAEGVIPFLQKKKNRRLIRFDADAMARSDSPWEVKKLLRGALLQEWDAVAEDPSLWQVVTKRVPSPDELEALAFGWKVVSLLRSNAIALTGRDRVFGLGGGQTSRVDSTYLAIWKAQKYGHSLSSAVCASDGFFPYRDSLDELHRHGIRAVIQPGGSKSDPDVIQAADEFGMAMIFTGYRHFKH